MKRASIDDILTTGQCATVLKALADKTRLRLLESLLVEEKCVMELARELRCPQCRTSPIIFAFFAMPG